MCTAVTFLTKDHYFGRNLDLEYHYNETVTIAPRNFPLHFRRVQSLTKHFAMIGMATVANDYPLYYDATNECGLSMAGLNFPENAVYYPEQKNTDNITPFEFIPWILGQCKTVEEAQRLIQHMNLVNISFSDVYPLSPLHWIIADRQRSITVEPLRDGLRVYDNPIGILTNNPFFDYHLYNLSNYMNLTRNEPTNRFAESLPLTPYSRGMGAIGLPGDLSSASRFVRAAFIKLNSVCDENENASISQFFHILSAVAQQNGCCQIGENFEKTIYSSCCNTGRGIYYYTTYENRQITAVDMHQADLDSSHLQSYPLIVSQQIRYMN